MSTTSLTAAKMEEVSDKSPLVLPYAVHPSSQINVQDGNFAGNGINTQATICNSTDQLGSDVVSFTFSGNRKFTIKARRLTVILTIVTILTGWIAGIAMPLLDNTVDKYNDLYPVLLYQSLWFVPMLFGLVYLNKKFLNPLAETKPSVPQKVMALIGFLSALGGLLVGYASDLQRTSGTLQALLSTSTIPFTVIFRYILLRKGVGRARLVCTGIVLIGLFIALEPEIFNIGGSSAPVPGAVTGVMKVVWPIIYLLGFVPMAIMNVILEKEMKHEQTESLVFVAWTQTYQCLFTLLFFWTDFIPEFGAAGSIQEFGRNMLYTLKCIHFADSTCMTAVPAFAVFMVSFCIWRLVTLLLLRYAEGAIWLVLVQALVTPLSSLFFTLFSVTPPPGQDHGTFHWDPNFDLAVAFRFLGLIILVPTVIFYNYFGEKEQEAEQQKMLSLDKSLVNDEHK